MDYQAPTYEEMRRYPGFPKPRWLARYSMFHQRHPWPTRILFTLFIVTGIWPFFIFYGFYGWRVEKQREQHLADVQAWWQTNWVDVEAAHLTQREAELSKVA